MYWCSPLPVRRLQPAESYNPISFSSFSWMGATTHLALVVAKILVRRCCLLKATTFSFFQGPRFINFQTGSISINHQVFLHQTISFSPIRTESSRYFSDSCTQSTITVTTHQILNPEHYNNKQKQLDHN